jgi:hypothetical protein
MNDRKPYHAEAVSSVGPRDSAAFEVLEALGQPGCAVCQLALRSVRKMIGSIAYEQVNDPPLRKELRRARGFCNRHAYMWLREAHSVLGTALIYRDVLHAALRELETGEPGGGLLRGWLGAGNHHHRRRARCPACRAQMEAEARYVDVLLELTGDSAGQSALETSDGLCVRHTLAAVRAGGPRADVLVQLTQRRVATLVAELDEVIRKEDYRFRDEPRTDGERTAPARAIGWAAGAEGMVDD